MSIPAKGSRQITVDNELYRWLIRRKATYSQTDYGNGTLTVAVQHQTAISGSTLVIRTSRPHPKDWGTEEVIAITPKDVAEWIREAQRQGWEPKKPGAQFVLS